MTAAYDLLVAQLDARGDDVARVEAALRAQEVETPSWAFGNSGTRFAVFAQPGVPRDPFEKLEDAAEVQRLTGIARSVALHIPWDRVDDLNELRGRAAELGLRLGAINPNLFQEPEYKLGSLCNPDAGVRRRAVAHVLRVHRDRRAASAPTPISLWLADGTNYPGQDSLRGAPAPARRRLHEVYAALAATRWSCSSSTSSTSRRSTPPTSPTGARRCSSARSSATGPRCSSTSATTPRA